MNNKNVLPVFLCLLLILGNLTACKSQQMSQEKPMERDIEIYLKTAKIVSTEISPEGGRTAPWKVFLNDGKISRKGHFKYIDRTRPSQLADSYKYEIAAYELNKLLDLDVTLPIVEREIEGMKGSLQLFMEGCTTESDRRRKALEPPDPESFQSTLEEINVFENLVYDEECFDEEDTLIHLEDWKIYRVDFSRAFAPEKELIPGCMINRCSRKFYENLQKLSPKMIRATLKPYLNSEEINALLERRKLILDTIKTIIKEKGEESVLFSV